MTELSGRLVRPSGRRLRAFTHNPLVALGAAVVAVYILAALAAPLLAGHPPQVQYLDERLAPPGPRFPLGLDQLGRTSSAGCSSGRGSPSSWGWWWWGWRVSWARRSG